MAHQAVDQTIRRFNGDKPVRRYSASALIIRQRKILLDQLDQNKWNLVIQE